MSQACRFRLWHCPELRLHPQGVVPQAIQVRAGGAGSAGSAGSAGHIGHEGHEGEGEQVVPQPISGPLPLGFADALRAHLETAFGGRSAPLGAKPSAKRGRFPRGFLPRRPVAARALRREGERFLASLFPALSTTIGAPDPPATFHPWQEVGRGSLLPDEPEIQWHAVEILSGRRLLAHEIESALGQRGVSFFGSIDVILDPLVHEGIVTRQPGVGVVRSPSGSLGGWLCRRCLSPNIGYYPCHRCGLDTCPQCDDCRTLGTSSACSVLYERPLGPDQLTPESRDVRVKLPFTLSPFQQQVSGELVQSERDALVWAACGSGKTEVTLEAIATTVRRGGRALFAVPRRDVADQLGRRLQEALSGVETVTLRGGTPHAYHDAPVVVSTVHQAIRFCERFDLIIVDEIDAFPLNREVWLLGALERAKRRGGRLVAMTATPPERLLRRIGKGDLRCLTLPGRPHGHPLPVPEIILDSGLAIERLQYESYGDKPPGWLSSLEGLVGESLRQDRRVLLFVPSVRMTSTVAELLLKAGRFRPYRSTGQERSCGTSRLSGLPRSSGLDRPSGWARSFEASDSPHCADSPRYALAAVHAGDGERTDKVAALEAGHLDLLVSTSILERGVTLPRLDVIVFAADWERVFDAAALVQMAGRVGRSPEDPSGRVVFFARSTTPAMREAIATIRRFNEIALEKTSQF